MSKWTFRQVKTFHHEVIPATYLAWEDGVLKRAIRLSITGVPYYKQVESNDGSVSKWPVGPFMLMTPSSVGYSKEAKWSPSSFRDYMEANPHTN